MKAALLALALIVAFAPSVRADEAAPEVSTPTNHVSLLLQPIGYGPSGMFSAGLIGQYWLDQRSMLVLELMRNINNVSYGDVSNGRHVDRQGASIGAHYKRFVWGRVYLKAGLDGRTLDDKQELSGDVGSFSATSLAATFAVGTQWQNDHFTLGVDWYGYSIPLSHRYRDEVTPATSSVASYIADDKKRVEEGWPSALRLYVGVTF